MVQIRLGRRWANDAACFNDDCEWDSLYAISLPLNLTFSLDPRISSLVRVELSVAEFEMLNSSIVDITPAAGWIILDCDPRWHRGEHDVRIICSGTSEQMENCEHVYENGGWKHTIVRLPHSVS